MEREWKKGEENGEWIMEKGEWRKEERKEERERRRERGFGYRLRCSRSRWAAMKRAMSRTEVGALVAIARASGAVETAAAAEVEETDAEG